MSSARHSLGFEYDTTALFLNNEEAMLNYIHPNKMQLDPLLHLTAMLTTGSQHVVKHLTIFVS
jgi:hypothetical protein